MEKRGKVTTEMAAFDVAVRSRVGGLIRRQTLTAAAGTGITRAPVGTLAELAAPCGVRYTLTPIARAILEVTSEATVEAARA